MVGTDLKDTFIGEVLTINSSDSLDGGLGNDTAELTLNSNITNAVKLASIENVVLTSYGARSVDMENMSGVETVYTNESTGIVTLNNVTDADMAIGFKGLGTNSISAFYQAGVLDGTTDTINVVLESAKNVNITVESGFEAANLKVSGDSTISSYMVPGVDSLTITGSGSLGIGALRDIKTVTATGFEGALTTGTVNATTGDAEGTIDGGSAGTSLLLGSGNDNIGFKGLESAGESNLIKLGAGDDRATIELAGSGSIYVSGEDGDDLVRITGTNSLSDSDVIDLGAGNDTLNIASASSNLVLRGVENLTLTKTATAVTIANDAGALNVTQTVGGETLGSAVNIGSLSNGSTVTVQGGANETVKTATDVTVGYRNTQEAATINITNGMTGSLETSEITDVTVNLGAASDIGGSYAFNDATSATLNATGALTSTAAALSVNNTTLTSFTVNGTDTVALEGVTSEALESVSVTAAKDLSTGAIGADSTKLTSVNLESTGGSIALTGTIGSLTNTGVLSVNATAKDSVTLMSVIDPKVGDVTLTSTADDVTFTTIGAGTTPGLTTQIGDVKITASGDIKGTSIGAATQDASVVASVGNIALTSTTGLIELAGVHVLDKDGVTVDLNAKTSISNGTTTSAGGELTHDATAIENTGGNITVNVSGAAEAHLNLVNHTSGISNLNASNTGGGLFTLLNGGTAGKGETSTVKLGNAVTGKSNAVEIGGTVDTISITGGSGTDVVSFGTATSAIKGGTIDLMGGSGDTLDMTNFASTTAFDGVAVNFGPSFVSLANGNNATQLVHGRVNLYDNDATENTTKLSTGLSFDVKGVDQFVGTAKADYIAAGNQGMTITGGMGADEIVLHANGGADTVVFTHAEAGARDTVTGFDLALDTLNVDALLSYTLEGAVVEGDVLGFVDVGAADTKAAKGQVKLATGDEAITLDEVVAFTALAADQKAIVVIQHDATTPAAYFDAQVYLVDGTQSATLIAVIGVAGDHNAVLQSGDFA